MPDFTAILPLPAPPENGDLGPLPEAQLGPATNEDDKMEEEVVVVAKSVASHTNPIGIIYPPPDIRSIVDKTAQFVAKNGPEFEKRIIANNAGNVKFNFLSGSDPYHNFYQHRLGEYRAQNLAPGQGQEGGMGGEGGQVGGEGGIGDEVMGEEKVDHSAQFRPVKKVLEPPEAEQYSVSLPEGIVGEELDIIRLTAQFVARNGRSFLNGLTSREMNSPLFHFMKPTHSMFTFFTALADAYSKVLMPPKGLKEKLQKSVVDKTFVFERCLHRLEWEKSQEQARQKAEDEIELERVQMAMIDWHDFVVVESIDFADDEDEALPMPMTLEEVIRRSKVTSAADEEIVEPGKEVEMEMDEEEMQFVQEGMKAASLEENGEGRKNEVTVAMDEDGPPSPRRIVKNYKRPEERLAAERAPKGYGISPFTGELIPDSEMSEHVRISLIDPKYKEQRDRMVAKLKDTTLASDDDLTRNIVLLARTRPDIFGTTEEEVSSAVQTEVEKKDDQPKQVIWDGHTGSIGRTANQALQNMGVEDQYDNYDGRALPGPAAPPPPRPGVPVVRPLPPPPGLALNMPRVPAGTVQYPPPPSSGHMLQQQPRPQMAPVNPMMRPPPPPMQMHHGQQPHMMMNRPPMQMNQHGIPVPPPPGSQFTPLGVHRPFTPMPPPGMPIPPPPMPQGMPPPPPEEAPPPLPEEPEPKRQKVDDSALIPEDQFLAQHPGPVRINVSVPNVDEGNLKGQVLEITMQSASETVGSLKEKISGEIQLPANKQKLSGKAGFLKDNLSLAYYNIGVGESLTLSLRERGGRKR